MLGKRRTLEEHEKGPGRPSRLCELWVCCSLPQPAGGRDGVIILESLLPRMGPVTEQMLSEHLCNELMHEWLHVWRKELLQSSEVHQGRPGR